MLLYSQWIKEEIKRVIKKMRQMKMKPQCTKMYVIAKGVLRGKFIVISIYLKKESSQVNN